MGSNSRSRQARHHSLAMPSAASKRAQSLPAPGRVTYHPDLPNTEYVYRALRIGEQPESLRQPNWAHMSKLSPEQLRLVIMDQVAHGNAALQYKECKILSTSSRLNCVTQLHGTDGRKHLYGGDFVRIQLSAFSPEQVVVLHKVPAKWFHEEDRKHTRYKNKCCQPRFFTSSII